MKKDQGRIRMRKVYSALHPTEAYLVKGLLAAENIESEVRGDILFGIRGELPITQETAPTVWIRDSTKLKRARAIIHLYETRNKSDEYPSERWRCATCGELHGPQFSHCWQCGGSRLQADDGGDGSP